MEKSTIRRKVGIIALLSQMMGFHISQPKPDMKEVTKLQAIKSSLLLNTGGVIPSRLPNQRQRRKLRRQQSHGK